MSLQNINKSLLTKESTTKALFSPIPKEEEDWIDLRKEFPEEPSQSTRKGKKSTKKSKDTMTRWNLVQKPQ